MKKTKHENLYLKGDTYYWREKGYTLSTGTTKVGLAKRKRDEFRQKFLGIKKTKRHTFEEAFDYAIEIKKGKSPKTLSEAISQDKRLRPWFKKNCKYLDMFERHHERYWNQYAEYARKQNMEKLGRPGKLWHDLKYLLYALNRAHKNGWIRRKFERRDFFLDDVREDTKKALSDAEAKRLLDNAKESSDRLHDQIKIALYTGMRKTEILGLSVSEIDFRKRKIKLSPKRVKTRMGRPIDIPNDVLDILKELVKVAKGKKGEFIFPYYDQVKRELDYSRHQPDLTGLWDKVRDQANVKCKFHDLRRTCATNLMKAGYPMSAASKQLGMGIDVLNKIYAQIDEDLSEKFRNIFDNKF